VSRSLGEPLRSLGERGEVLLKSTRGEMFFGLVDRKGRKGLGLVERWLALSPAGLLEFSLALFSDIVLLLSLFKFFVVSKEIAFLFQFWVAYL